MSLAIAFLILFGSGEESVLLEVQGGDIIKGTLLNIDGEGNYVVRSRQGGRRTVPYEKVLNVESAGTNRSGTSLYTQAYVWPEFERCEDLVSRVMHKLPELPEGGSGSAAGAFGEAVELVREGELRIAARKASEAVDGDPSWEPPLLLCAALYAELGILPEAQEFAALSVRGCGELPLACEIASEISYRRGLRNKAEELRARALKARYEGAERNWVLGHFWQSRGRSQRAESFFRAYLKEDPELNLPFCVEGRLLRRARAERERGNLGKAASWFAVLMEKSPVIGGRHRKEFGRLLRLRSKRLTRQGKLAAAYYDLKEAVKLVPGESESSKQEARILASRSLYKALKVVSSLAEISAVSRQLRSLWPELPGEAKAELKSALTRVGRSLLKKGGFKEALDCLKESRKYGERDAEIVKLVKEIAEGREKGGEGGYSAAGAEAVSGFLSDLSPELLRSECKFLLKPQLRELRGEFEETGPSESLREKLSKLRKQFGPVPALKAFQKNLAERNTKKIAGKGEAGPEGYAFAREEILKFFPLKEGRWWKYVSSDGCQERWCVASMEKKGSILCARLTGKVENSGGSFSREKKVYLTGSELWARAPSGENGGTLLLWKPMRGKKKTRNLRSRWLSKEFKCVSRSEKVVCNGVTFENCIHIQMISAPVGMAGDPQRLSVRSHYWYAPGVGLVRTETENGQTWTIQDWGGTEENKEESS